MAAFLFAVAGCGNTPLELPFDGGARDLSAGGGTVDLSGGGGQVDLSLPTKCPGSNPTGCRNGGACPPSHYCSTNPKDGCAPSACSCDTTTGSWVCTADCGGGVCVPVGNGGCSGPSPEGCRNSGCAAGQVCDTTQGCMPSSCKCDPATGGWVCTDDCGGGVCVPSGGLTCAGANPQGCVNAGCPKGQACSFTSGCAPSSCKCDTTTGSWVCTKDCGGGICVPNPIACTAPNPQGCVNTGCPANQTCSFNFGCAPSSCKCDATTGSWVCTKDCGGGICIPNPTMCTSPNPQGCISTGCAAGYVCDTKQGCFPSACKCDSTGKWYCTSDCGGGTCVKQTQITCPSPNPAGCLFNGCPSGQRCDTTAGCKPSYCKCDFSTGMWSCATDCGGGICVP